MPVRGPWGRLVPLTLRGSEPRPKSVRSRRRRARPELDPYVRLGREDRREPPGLLLGVGALLARQATERFDAQPRVRLGLEEPPPRGDHPVDEHRAPADLGEPRDAFRDDPGAVLVADRHVVVLGEEAYRRGNVRVGERRARDVEELAAVLVADGAEARSRSKTSPSAGTPDQYWASAGVAGPNTARYRSTSDSTSAAGSGDAPIHAS